MNIYSFKLTCNSFMLCAFYWLTVEKNMNVNILNITIT